MQTNPLISPTSAFGANPMSAKSLTIVTSLLFAAWSSDFVIAAHAQGNTFSTQASAATSNHPGTSRAESGYRPGERVAFAASDPPEVQYGSSATQQLRADTAASTGATQGQLHAEVSAATVSLNATYFPNNTVSGGTDARFTDTVEVVSDRLAANTPVTLTFRVAMAAWRDASGLYEGAASCTLRVAGSDSTSSWRLHRDEPLADVPTPELTLSTFVGARLQIAARLTTEARALFSDRGSSRGGRLAIGAYCNTPLESASEEIRLVSASGTEYLSPPR